MTINNQIRKYRLQKGLTQRDLANKLYVSPKLVSKWETEIISPSIEYLPRLAQVLDIKVQDLLIENKPKENKFLKFISKLKPKHIELDIELKFHFKKD